MKKVLLVFLFLAPQLNGWKLANEQVKKFISYADTLWDQLERSSRSQSISTLEYLINRKLISSDFASLITSNNKKDADSFKEAFSLLMAHALYETYKQTLDWCLCIAPGYRLTLIMLLLQDALENHPNKRAPLVITSLGSGDLLQDYLFGLMLLKSGYTTITFNLIDVGYPQMSAFEKSVQKHLKKIKQIAPLQELQRKLFESEFTRTFLKTKTAKAMKDFLAEHGINRLSNKLIKKLAQLTTRDAAVDTVFDALEAAKKENILEQLDQMRTKLYAYALHKGLTNPSITLNLYSSTADYSNRVSDEKNKDEKSNYLYMVDPGIGLASATNYPAEANSIGIKNKDKELEVLLFIPPNNHIHLYTAPNTDPAMVKAIRKMVGQNRMKSNKRTAIINELLEKYPQRARVYSDPHSAFQSLLKHTAAEKHKAFALIHKNYKNPERFSPELYQIKTDDYLKLDVIAPYIGAYISRNMQLKELPI